MIKNSIFHIARIVRDTFCSEFDYIVNNVDDIDEEDMTQNHMKFGYFLEVLIDK